MARSSEKQRLRANRQRLRLLFTWAVVAAVLYPLGSWFRRRSSNWHWFLFVSDNALVWSIYVVLAKAAAPEFDKATGTLVDAGQDLRATGVTEYLLDALYTALTAETLASFWGWFWLILMVIPAYMIAQLISYLARVQGTQTKNDVRASALRRPGNRTQQGTRPMPHKRRT
ncbi:hypothetical protein F1559_003397 [Cyanidiococcus yangmingshanensis]|uniref:Transmembrane protein n=1 Tax=Cyanidiococcus yangmingshanensis TaxID=2690220 RepID=A0A7J7IJQ6_9RHOD|nr:hypothetical protein F1559_003397 [Cyanidiococcus yangmingshanensis]